MSMGSVGAAWVKHEDGEYESSLSYRVRFCLNKQNKTAKANDRNKVNSNLYSVSLLNPQSHGSACECC